MKKVLAIVLALIMACSALTMAFAADTAATPAEPTTESGLIGAVKGILHLALKPKALQDTLPDRIVLILQ